ncbi:BACON domain-containing protein [Pontiella agarivorans]|uniref:BACON domain-containing protein n=1 Tax=Pontiella agarivorans TaxID=3038953 RepID=A0ABU5MTF2_9BACT|nr:BACON domain-containing protein [Pontiella agarivorans]MDZ8117486.1 BACON domain-containing protein [Pontiella agarivorans]
MKTRVFLFVSTQLFMLFTVFSVQAQTPLTWDPGTAQSGTEIYSNTDTNAGSYLFTITTTSTVNNVGYWRSVLTVTSGEADLYMSTSPSVTTNYYSQKSDTVSNDRITRALSGVQTWYILVESEAHSTWSLFAGDMHVHDLTWDPGTAQSGTEVYTNPGTAEGSYLFRIVTQDTPNNAGLWRTVLNLTAGEADLYTDPNANIAPNEYQYRSEAAGSDTIVQSLSAGQTRYILVEAEEGAAWSLFSGDIKMNTLAWDPGTADTGTAVFNNLNTDGGAYYFKLTTELPDLAAWRTALYVLGGEADLYIRQNALPYVNSGGQSYTENSIRTGDDGFTRYLSETGGAGQEWYILVLADTGSTWNLLSGDVFARDLGALAADASSGSGMATIPPEEIRYFKTTIPSATYAWRLWLQDAAGSTTLSQPFYVRHGLAPHPSSSSHYDRARTGQGLLVPTYLVPGDPAFYYVGVPGTPGDTFQLDSRQHEITDETYNHTLNAQSQSGFLFKTYRIPVPPEQIAWEVTVEPVNGTDPNFAVRQSMVPNAFNNDAFSEVADTNISDSITLVPETLSDGTFYVTVYGDAAVEFNLRNREPVITQIDFIDTVTNDDPLRVGWRYYAVSDIAQQLGQLGWLLQLTNHVDGTEIAIRRNYVPGRWNYRKNGSANIYSSSDNDQSSTLGFLQDPDHDADVWYIGVYYPYAALGTFTLDSGSHTPIEIPMDGYTNTTLSLKPNSYHFYRVTVPAQTNGQNVLGWELRMTSWTNERPYMIIRRDQLPEGTSQIPLYWYPWNQIDWNSGNQWPMNTTDWTGYTYDPGGQAHPQPLHSMAMGNPLEPGSYFIAFYNNSDSATAGYTFTSSAIGTGMTYEPATLGFIDSAIITDLPARAVQYFKVNIASNTPSWQLRLENTSGESQLYIREARVPTRQTSTGDTTSPGQYFTSFTRLQQTGDELFTLLPESGETTIPAGDYYLMVVSEGQSPAGSTIGTGTASAILHSLGEASVNALGTLNPGGLLSDAQTYVSGETVLYQFDIAANVPALEVRLENTTGSPSFYLRQDENIPNGPGYGIYSGHNDEYNDTEIRTFANPSTGTWSIVVGKAGNPAAGAYTLEIHALDYTEITLDGGGDTDVALPPEEWIFYHVDVPAQTNGQDVIGWELKMTDWMGARPRMYIRRDLLPSSYGVPSWYYPWSSASWPNGQQWSTQSQDWSGYTYDPAGTAHPSPLLSMAMGAPLEPGSYYIGFHNTSTTETGTFSFASSAIGTGMTYDPRTLAAAGSESITDLPARNVEYFKLTIPAGQPSWRFELENTSGESQLYIREARVPTWGMAQYAYTSPGASFSSMTRLQTTGSEHFTLLPESGHTTIPEGDYYLMVVSEGQNPNSSTIGTNSASAILHSHGTAPVTDLGILLNPNTLSHPDTYDKGRINRYQFTVPASVQSMQIRLDDAVGSPEMNLRLDTSFPNGASYGVYSGFGAQYSDTAIINFSEPDPGTWSLMINDSRNAGSMAAGAYTLRIVTSGTTPVIFDGGAATNVVLPPETWHHYKVEVPVQTNGNDVIGWEMRLTEWSNSSGSRPHMYIRRDELPASSGVPGWYYPYSYTEWPSGFQWRTTSSDWSKRSYTSDGSQAHPKYLLSMGIDRPLSAPGTYYVSFYNAHNVATSTYSFVSSGIGMGMTYEPQPMGFVDSATVTSLPARDVQYFSVEVPTNTANWKIRLENTSGETTLHLREAHVPTWGMAQYAYTSPGASISTMVRLDKDDDEYFILHPENGATTIPPGKYYLMVTSLGQNPTGSYIGTGTSSAILHSLGEQTVPHLGSLPYGGSLTVTNTYLAGEADNTYRFDVTNSLGAVELSLIDVAAGNPRMYLRKDAGIPNGVNYGAYSGYNDEHYSDAIITIANPSPDTWSMLVADPDYASSLQNGEYTLRITHKAPADLAFDARLSTNAITNVVSGLLADNQRDFFRVDVPEMIDGEPILGWYITTQTTQGDALTRVRKNLLPADGFGINQGQTPFDSPAQVIVPPLLTPGTWYIEVKGDGATDYTLTSSAIRLEREWTMPEPGQTNNTPGVADPFFGDSGIDEDGDPLPIDQGVDLENGYYHFYTVEIPDGNTGLLRTQLEAISGNPNLYIRPGLAPTTDYSVNYAVQYDHRLDSTSNTEYGNWVPKDGRYEMQLEPGIWHLMVKADGGSTARYRLRVSGGNVYTNGNVQSLSLNDPGYSGQLLAEGDWRYYRVDYPTNPPVDWNITYSQESGNVDLYLRDTVPPGNHTRVADSYIRDWDNDDKNSGTLQPDYPEVGTHTVNMPPLRPGHTYYLGFLARSDASFSVSSASAGGLMPTYEKVDFETGFVNTNIPAGVQITYQVDVPEDAVRWIHSTTNTADIHVYLEQGTLPSKTTYDHYRNINGRSTPHNKYLLRLYDEWPWRPGYTYYFTVTNTAATAQSFVLVMGGSRAPEIPQNVSATDGTRENDVRVTWNSISGVGYYEVWRNTTDDPATAINLVSGTSGNSYNDTSAVPGQLYYYWVSVAGKTDTAWFSDGDSGWRPGSGTISPAQAVFTSAGGSGTVDVTAPAGTLWTAAESLSWLTFDAGVPGTNDGEVVYSISEYGSTVARTGTITVANQAFTVVQLPLGVPVNVQATDGDFSDRTEVSWDSLAHADRYYIYRNHTNTTSGASYLGYVTTNTFSDIGGQENRTYFYFVRSWCSGGYGGYSAPDTGHRGTEGVTPEWINTHFPCGGPETYGHIDSGESSPAGFVIHWTAETNHIYGIRRTGGLANPFVPLVDGLAYPQNAYTDTLHAAESTGFYRLTVRCIGTGYPGDDADSDGDGYTNYEEFLYGTDPNNPLSYPGNAITGYMAPSGFVLNWTSVSGQRYGILWTDSLTNLFTLLTNGVPYPVGSFTDTLHSAESQGFYRLQIEPE